jgi:hypothetical protein
MVNWQVREKTELICGWPANGRLVSLTLQRQRAGSQ